MEKSFPKKVEHVVLYPVIETEDGRDLSSTCITVIMEDNTLQMDTLRIVQQQLTHAQRSSISRQLADPNYGIEEAKYIEARFQIGEHNKKVLPLISFDGNRLEDKYPDEFAIIYGLLQQLY